MNLFKKLTQAQIGDILLSVPDIRAAVEGAFAVQEEQSTAEREQALARYNEAERVLAKAAEKRAKVNAEVEEARREFQKEEERAHAAHGEYTLAKARQTDAWNHLMAAGGQYPIWHAEVRLAALLPELQRRLERLQAIKLNEKHPDVRPPIIEAIESAKRQILAAEEALAKVREMRETQMSPEEIAQHIAALLQHAGLA